MEPEEGWTMLLPARSDSPSSTSSPRIDPRLRGPSMWSIWRCGEAVELSEDRLTATYSHKKTKVGTLQSDLPFSPVQNICYFEIKILDIGKKGKISIGLADARYSLEAMPGWLPTSYGFHGDTGDKYWCSPRSVTSLAYKPSAPPNTPTAAPASASPPRDVYASLYPKQRRYSIPWRTGDVIGCGLNNTTHDLFFTRNGKSLGPAFERVMGVFYPTVALHSAGEAIQVRFRPPFLYSLYLNSAPPEIIDYLPRGLDMDHGSALTVYADGVAEYTSEVESNPGVVQSDQPFNPAKDIGYYEVTILERGSKGWFAIGLAVAHHDHATHPGWVQGSWAYHGDDGKKFAENGYGEDFGPTYSKNDVIGCGYSYRRKEIFFTKNGQLLGVAFSHVPDQLILYPTVGMQSLGERVRINLAPPFLYETPEILKTFMPQSPAVNTPPSRRSSCEVPVTHDSSVTTSGTPSRGSGLRDSNHEVNFIEWTAHDVGEWIAAALGMPQYRDAFVRNDISGEMLPTLTPEIIKLELGVTSYGARMKIVREIGKLSGSHSNRNSGSFINDKEKGEHDDHPRERGGSDAPSPLGDRSLHIRSDELEMGEMLGKGFFGEVRKAHWRGTDVAVKIIYRKQFRTLDELSLFEKEIRILSILRHPCIVQFLGICTDSANCIVIEYMSGGNLETLVRNKFPVLNAKPSIREKIITNIAKGCCYLHERDPPILHRDLTPRNILLDKNFNAKVADFGLSRQRGENKMTIAVGFLPYQAPEVFKGEDYTEKADVYSFGMLVWFIFSGQSPDAVITPLKLANMVAHQGYRPSFPEGTPEFWQKLISACWDVNADTRPTFTELLRSVHQHRQEQGGQDEDGYLWSLIGRPENTSLTPRGSTSLSISEIAKLEQAYDAVGWEGDNSSFRLINNNNSHRRGSSGSSSRRASRGSSNGVADEEYEHLDEEDYSGDERRHSQQTRRRQSNESPSALSFIDRGGSGSGSVNGSPSSGGNGGARRMSRERRRRWKSDEDRDEDYEESPQQSPRDGTSSYESSPRNRPVSNRESEMNGGGSANGGSVASGEKDSTRVGRRRRGSETHLSERVAELRNQLERSSSTDRRTLYLDGAAALGSSLPSSPTSHSPNSPHSATTTTTTTPTITTSTSATSATSSTTTKHTDHITPPASARTSLHPLHPRYPSPPGTDSQ
eukprot:TRINITY_DN5098_c1_g1_i1.p1 TRINITY_DN5098_c1_g1~~TRINITY_DN5098_c1_g1_i1.p1  ORF type:complete len:1182 (+),score=164.99 TRINITY_DN5098_c1_g1_i1:699-4244(+)